ncbi:MAG: hypothetical protein DLM58_12570 [Pseudonocardiales bacterium]|nr:MAG: hypothetical protein DLM58_12570 [Pseudonocardiales bacterium]
MGIAVIALVGTPEGTAAQLADYSNLMGSVELGIAQDVACAIMHSIYVAVRYETSDSLPREFTDAGE